MIGFKHTIYTDLFIGKVMVIKKLNIRALAAI